MALHVLRDPRRYLLVVMAVALIVIVPLMFAFVTLTDTVLGDGGAGAGWIVLWALVGVAIAGLVVELMVILARATKLSDLEHETPGRGEDRAP